MELLPGSRSQSIFLPDLGDPNPRTMSATLIKDSHSDLEVVVDTEKSSNLETDQ